MGILLKDHNPKKEALVKGRTPPFFFLPRIPLNVKYEDICQIVGVNSFDLRLTHFRSSTPQYVMASICSQIRQRGRVVSASHSQSGGPGFESRSGDLLDLFSFVPS